MDVRIAEPPARWRLITDSHVGVATVSDYDIRVTPKLAIPRSTSTSSYAVDPRGWRELGPLFDVEDDLFSAIAHGFALQAERALGACASSRRPGVEESDATLARAGADERSARRGGADPHRPSLTYDDHLLDIPENRLIRGQRNCRCACSRFRSPYACGCYACAQSSRRWSQRGPHCRFPHRRSRASTRNTRGRWPWRC